MSQRSIERLAGAMRMLQSTDTPDAVRTRLVSECTRPNGTINFSGFARRAEEIATIRVLADWPSCPT